MDNKTKTKAAMLNELESIKGLLLDEDDIPILQEVIESDPAELQPQEVANTNSPVKPDIVEQQQDFFGNLYDHAHELHAHTDTAPHSPVAAPSSATHRSAHDSSLHKHLFGSTRPARPTVTKASGENPFLPQHIRERLHGNNPPPLFAAEAAHKIASSSRPTTLLGSFSVHSSGQHQRDELIESILARVMPELEMELRERLEGMSKQMLEELNKP